MYRTVYYPDQQMHNMYINNILYIVSTAICFSPSASSSGRLILVLAKGTDLLKLQL
jgi:predicted oxidoreductase (fatty acid repression mutant protein)